jgi:hypothetical protein
MSDQPTTPQPAYPPAEQQPSAPKRRRPIGWIVALVATAVVFGSCGLAVGAGGDTETVAADASDPAPTVTETVTQGGAESIVEVTVTETAAAPAPEPAPEPEAPAAAFSDGQYIIGTDVTPGRYRTVLPAEETGGFCYADIQNGEGNFLAQEVRDAGQTILDVPDVAGAILSTQGCGDWEAVG